MPQRRSFVVTRIPNLRWSPKRGLAFLECSEDRSLNARRVYDKLKNKKRQMVRNRFDYWLDFGICDKYFHGWSNPQYRECFVFKWKDRAHQRLYGFLINPMPRTNPGFQVCVLYSHAQKNTENTDSSELNEANILRQDQRVINAVKKEHPESDLH